MKAEIITGSRLHFGLICGCAQTGWEFGGVGMMLRSPAWRISVVPSGRDHDFIQGSPEATRRVSEFLQQIRTTMPLPAVDLRLSEEIPFHTGLGGGTQLGLALAAATQLLVSHRAVHDPYQLAELAQRAERSAVGTAGFRDGGFLIDHGLARHQGEPRTVERMPIPESWRFVLVRPAEAQGLSGDQERSFFSKRLLMPRKLVEQLAELIDHQLVRSIQNAEFDTFAEGLERYGREVGQFYASEQGDVFAHPVIRQVVAELKMLNIHGAAQSSWGPGICIPASSVSHAQSIAAGIPHSIHGSGISVLISEPLNLGASLRTTAPEP